MFYKHSSVSWPAKYGQFTGFTFGWTHAFDSKQTIFFSPQDWKLSVFSFEKFLKENNYPSTCWFSDCVSCL